MVRGHPGGYTPYHAAIPADTLPRTNSRAMGPNAHFTCHLCGQEHQPLSLMKREKALCTRCDAVIAKGARFGPHAALVFSVTGLIFSVPALLLPFVGAGKLGNERMSTLLTGVGALWRDDMRLVALLVLMCGAVLPIALLWILACLHAPRNVLWRPTRTGEFYRAALSLEHWAIPEVQVLAVLVALMKLGRVVEITIGPAFWCYCGMALSLIIAQQSFDFEAVLYRPDGTTAPPLPQ
jgi:paraquat-inducible protein A